MPNIIWIAHRTLKLCKLHKKKPSNSFLCFMEKGEWTLGLQPLKFKVIYQDLRLRHIRIKTKRQMASESHVISCIYIHAFFFCLCLSLWSMAVSRSEWAFCCYLGFLIITAWNTSNNFPRPFTKITTCTYSISPAP